MAEDYKILGQVESIPDSVVSLYTVPEGKYTVSSVLSIVNTSSSATSYSVFAVPSSESASVLVPSDEFWVQTGADIDGEVSTISFAGWSVAMSADGLRVAIGAPWNNENGERSGHVRMYDWNGTAWVQLGQDIGGEAAFDQSGSSVSLSADGSRVAIGGEQNDGGGTDSGHVRVYSWNGTAWVQLGGDIDGEAAGDLSGWSVSLSADGSRVAIGARLNDGGGDASGHVRVYSWNGTAWVQLGQDIDGETADDTLGSSVSLSNDGSRVAIGAPVNTAGHVRVYSWNGTAWVQLGDDIDGETVGDYSGYSVSLSGDGSRVAIGAIFNDGGGTDSGHVRMYDWNGTAWVQLGQDIDGETLGDQSGSSVSLSNDGSRVAIGAPWNNENGERSGHVRMYDWNGTAWVQLGQDIDGETAFDSFGFSVAMSADGSRVAIGGPFNDANSNASGHVRVYDLNFLGTETVPQNKHTLINSKTISSGVHDEIVGGIQLSAGDAVLVSSPSGDVVFNMYGVETL